MLDLATSEQALIATAIHNPDTVADLTHIRQEHFNDPFLGHAWTVIHNLWTTVQPVDLMTVAAAHPDPEAPQKLLASYGSIGNTTSSGFHAQRVLDGWRRRQLVATAAWVSDQVGSRPDGDADEIVDHVEAEMARLRFVSVDDGPWPVAQSTAAERYQQRKDDEGHHRGARWRLGAMDALCAPMRPGQLVVVAARPSVGKTAVAVHTAFRNAEYGIGSLVISLEMSREDIEDRLAAYAANIPLSLLTQGELGWRDEARLAEAEARMRVLPIHLDALASPTLGHVRASARKAMRDPNVGLVIVDYLGLMSAPRQQNREQEIGALSRGLKAMAVDLNVPVMCLAQLNRGPEARYADGHRPVMSDLRDSGQIEADADMVVLLYRDAYYRKGEGEQNTMELIVAKQRQGPTGMAKVGCMMATGRLFDMDAGL